MSVYIVKKLVMRGKWDEGFTFYGPFDDDDDAWGFADAFWDDEEDERDRETTMVVDLCVPEDHLADLDAGESASKSGGQR